MRQLPVGIRRAARALLRQDETAFLPPTPRSDCFSQNFRAWRISLYPPKIVLLNESFLSPSSPISLSRHPARPPAFKNSGIPQRPSKLPHRETERGLHGRTATVACFEDGRPGPERPTRSTGEPRKRGGRGGGILVLVHAAPRGTGAAGAKTFRRNSYFPSNRPHRVPIKHQKVCSLKSEQDDRRERVGWLSGVGGKETRGEGIPRMSRVEKNLQKPCFKRSLEPGLLPGGLW